LFTVAGCLKIEEKKPTSGFPESFIITLRHLVGKTSLVASLCAWSLEEWYFKE
jgi:hypothetical protein